MQCTEIYIYIYVCLYTHIYEYVYVCMHIRMYYYYYCYFCCLGSSTVMAKCLPGPRDSIPEDDNQLVFALHMPDGFAAWPT